MNQNIWFTADTHLGHRNILKYLGRPFMNNEEQEQLAYAQTQGRKAIQTVRIGDASIQLHDSTIIDNINASVQTGDLLYILGDFCMGRLDEVRYYRNKINCNNVFLIRGNHDKLRDNEYKQVFNNIKDLDGVRWNEQQIILCHYPMLRWNNGHYGSWQLYGHCHGTLQDYLIQHDLQNLLSMDVGVDCHNYSPISIEDVKQIMMQKKPDLILEEEIKTEA